MHFLSWRSDQIESCISYMASLIKKLSPQTSPDPYHPPNPQSPLANLNHIVPSQSSASQSSKPHELVVIATGGGAYKYNTRIKEALGVEVLREDEMECLSLGLDFFLTEVPREVFSFHRDDTSDPIHFEPPAPTASALYPYLLVNVGSGVSMIKCSGPGKFERVGGTALGGGSFWGLASLLTGTASFEEILALADEGDNAPVDLLVKDIYGTDGYSKIGLEPSIIASSFGKVYASIRDESGDPSASDQISDPTTAHQRHDSSTSSSPKAADLARALLYAISNNIGQLACLYASQNHTARIYFGGSFVRHRQILSTLTFAVDFYSQSTRRAYFLRHNGFLGSVGAFLKRQPKGFGRRASVDLGS